ncbi:MAG: class I SAM-dependent methyltransferase [Chloroflexi bacterium]|nr:class I SAM-dependent methyltransferase [Chloroflexota bacterium]
MDERDQKAIVWGHPSYVWDFGQERRLEIVRQHVDLSDKRVLDIGCGVGAYVRAFRRYTPHVFGVDLDEDKVLRAGDDLPNLCLSPGETLPFRADSFDMTFLHEVIEHVEDDRQTVAEAWRVTKPGGKIVIYAPNRLYFFETHGFYFRGQYHYKLCPFVNYLPRRLRDVFCPHVRVYGAGDIRRLFEGLTVDFTAHSYVYPGFDKMSGRNERLALTLRKVLYALEDTPLNRFGLSHFLVATKLPVASAETSWRADLVGAH